MHILLWNVFIFFAATFFIALSTVLALRLSTIALTSLICLEVVLMNLFVTKQIVLFGLHATASDALGIGAVLGINLLREYSGKKAAMDAVILSFLAVAFYVAASLFHLAYIPALEDAQHVHFMAILAPMPRIMAASMVTYLLVQSIEYVVYGWLKECAHGRFFIARNYAVLLVTQLLDTVLFSVLGLYGLVNYVGDIIVVSYTIKVVVIIIATPVVALMRRYVTV